MNRELRDSSGDESLPGHQVCVGLAILQLVNSRFTRVMFTFVQKVSYRTRYLYMALVKSGILP